MSEFTEEEKKKIEDLERYAKMSFEEQLKYAREQIKDVSERYGAIKERVDISKDVMSDKDINDAEKRAAFVEQYKKINEEYRELGKNYRNLSEEDKNKDVFYLITDRIAYLEDVSVMKGATAEADGSTGTVPVPKAGDQNKFLRGDGTWAESSGGNSSDNTPYTITTSEDGNTFTQTYDDGRVITITKTTTGFREISKDSSGSTVSDITTTINDDGSIRSENTSK